VAQPPAGDGTQIAQFHAQIRMGGLTVAKTGLMPVAEGGGDLQS